MNIVLVSHSYLPSIGGVEIVVNNLAKQLRKNGHKVCIITAIQKGLEKYEKIDGIQVYRLRFNIPRPSLRGLLSFFIRFPVTFINMAFIIKSINADIVNVHFPINQSFYVLLLKYLQDFPLVVTVHGNDVHKFPNESVILRWLLKNILKKAEFVTACSLSLLNDAKIFCSGIESKSLPIGNGIDLEEFNIQDKYVNANPYILALGRFVYKKGFDILINAFKIIAEKYPTIDLILAGDGEERKKLEALCIQSNLQERVKFLSLVDREEVIKLFNGCEFFVLPSRIEPFGIVNLEAMAASKPIVAMRVNGVSEIIRDGENGILVDSIDHSLLAEKIIYLIKQDCDIRAEMGKVGRKIVEEDYTWRKISDKYLGVYKKSISNLEFRMENKKNLSF